MCLESSTVLGWNPHPRRKSFGDRLAINQAERCLVWCFLRHGFFELVPLEEVHQLGSSDLNHDLFSALDMILLPQHHLLFSRGFVLPQHGFSMRSRQAGIGLKSNRDDALPLGVAINPLASRGSWVLRVFDPVEDDLSPPLMVAAPAPAGPSESIVSECAREESEFL